jgi:excisionase family DNA binding protein
MTDVSSEYYKPQEVAIRMRVSIRTVYAWIKDGTIPGVQIGRTVRIPAAPFEALMERMRKGQRDAK